MWVPAMMVLFIIYQQKLMDDAETCRRKMNAAAALIEGLGGEKIRWTEQSQEFKAQMGRYGNHGYRHNTMADQKSNQLFRNLTS